MSTPDDDWTDLSEAWARPQLQEPPLDAGFVRALRRRDRLARINFYAETGGCVVAGAVVVWAMVREHLPWGVAAAAVAFSLFALVATIWTRRGDPGLLVDTPQAALRSAMAQARIGLRWAYAGVAICLMAAVFLCVTALASGRLIGPVLIPFAAGWIFLLACVPFYLNHARRCRRRMAAHQAALDALQEREGVTHVRS